MFQLTAEELVGITTVVVGFTELVKLSKFVDEKYGMLIAALISILGIAAYATSKPELAFTRFMIWPFVSAFLIVITSAGGVYGIIRTTRGADAMDASGPRNEPRIAIWLVAILGGTALLNACGKSAPILVGESATVASAFIQTASNAVMPLVPNPLSREKALDVQDKLEAANNEIKRLIPVLRAIDAAQKVGDPAAPQVEEAIRMVQNISTSLNLSVKGVPVAEAAAKLLEIVNNARGAMATIQATLDALKNRKSGDLLPSIHTLEDLMAPVAVFTN